MSYGIHLSHCIAMVTYLGHVLDILVVIVHQILTSEIHLRHTVPPHLHTHTHTHTHLMKPLSHTHILLEDSYFAVSTHTHIRTTRRTLILLSLQ